MDIKTLNLLNEVNRAIIQFRGIYSRWSAEYNISYNEMLVLYTIRENGYCTQKQICDSYLLPRQTINNVITGMRKNGILEPDKAHTSGREKAFRLSKYGKEYAKPLIEAMNEFEEKAVHIIGTDKLKTLTKLMTEYDSALINAFDREGE